MNYEIKDGVFLSDWQELVKGKRPTAGLIFEILAVALLAGIGPDVAVLAMGKGTDEVKIRVTIMMIVAVVVAIASVLSYMANPILGATVSTLAIGEDVVRITRHVVSDTGRRYFATWDSLFIEGCSIDEEHHVIQLAGSWKVSAYKMRGNEPGSYVDSEVRTQEQTFQMPADTFHVAVGYIKAHNPGIIKKMTDEQYKKALPFIHKHYSV